MVENEVGRADLYRSQGSEHMSECLSVVTLLGPMVVCHAEGSLG
jgi:hypothetical protein